jgi:three-Cys-motif partner protein
MDEDPKERLEEVGEASQIKLSVTSRYIGYRNERGVGGGFLNATASAKERYYIDGHASYGEDRVLGVFRRNGTPLIALDAEVRTKAGRTSRFDRLWFIEIDVDRAEELRRLVEQRGGQARAEVITGDVNSVMDQVLPQIHPRGPALRVLDPYDPDDLRFTTIERIARHDATLRQHKIELLINLPIGLQHRQARDKVTGRLRPNVVRNLELLLGNGRWMPLFEAWSEGKVPWYEVYATMKRSFVEELRRLGYKVFWEMDVPPGNPMYALVFASDHPLAGAIMESAMKDWERDPANPQRPLFG